MEKKPGWNYSYIDSLKMQIAINPVSGVLYTEDKTYYSPDECSLLSKVDYQIPQSVHSTKKTFGGTIISISAN